MYTTALQRVKLKSKFLNEIELSYRPTLMERKLRNPRSIELKLKLVLLRHSS